MAEKKKEIKIKTEIKEEKQEIQVTPESKTPEKTEPVSAESSGESQIPSSGVSVNNKKSVIWIVLIVIGVLVLIGGGIFVYQRAMSKKETDPVPATEVAEPTEAPEATPTPELARADLKIQVLNGSGVAGTAGEAQEFLEGLGYEDVATSNADNYDYEETEISIKEDKETYLEMLTDDLSEEYTLAAETTVLDEGSDYDVVITIGQE